MTRGEFGLSNVNHFLPSDYCVAICIALSAKRLEMDDLGNPALPDRVLDMNTSCNTQTKTGLDDDQATAFAKACGETLQSYRNVIAEVRGTVEFFGSIDRTADAYGMPREEFRKFCRDHGVGVDPDRWAAFERSVLDGERPRNDVESDPENTSG
jgi:hypothetical protein